MQAKNNTKPLKKALFWIDLCSFYFKVQFLVNLEVIDSITSQYYPTMLLWETRFHGFLIIHFELPLNPTFEYDLSKTN